MKIMCSDKECSSRNRPKPMVFEEKDLLKIGEWLNGSKCFVLQQFRGGDCIDSDFNSENKFSEQELNEFKDVLEPYFDVIEIRK